MLKLERLGRIVVVGVEAVVGLFELFFLWLLSYLVFFLVQTLLSSIGSVFCSSIDKGRAEADDDYALQIGLHSSCTQKRLLVALNHHRVAQLDLGLVGVARPCIERIGTCEIARECHVQPTTVIGFSHHGEA